MSSLQSVKPIFFRYTWQFRELYTDKISSISCNAFSTEEARIELLSTLKQIESIADEKKKVSDEINKLYRIRQTQSTEEKRITLNKIQEITKSLQQKFPQVNDFTGNSGIPVHDYSSDIKVIYYHKYTNEEITTTLATLISTIDPVTEYSRFVTFT
jgi:F0F1-type ATP synthase beta subunit